MLSRVGYRALEGRLRALEGTLPCSRGYVTVLLRVRYCDLEGTLPCDSYRTVVEIFAHGDRKWSQSLPPRIGTLREASYNSSLGLPAHEIIAHLAAPADEHFVSTAWSGSLKFSKRTGCLHLPLLCDCGQRSPKGSRVPQNRVISGSRRYCDGGRGIRKRSTKTGQGRQWRWRRLEACMKEGRVVPSC